MPSSASSDVCIEYYIALYTRPLKMDLRAPHLHNACTHTPPCLSTSSLKQVHMPPSSLGCSAHLWHKIPFCYTGTAPHRAVQLMLGTPHLPPHRNQELGAPVAPSPGLRSAGKRPRTTHASHIYCSLGEAPTATPLPSESAMLGYRQGPDSGLSNGKRLGQTHMMPAVCGARQRAP